MEYRIIIAGFGGQGVLFAGKVLAQAAVFGGYEAAWLPSYGPEMRGGTANCRLVISDKKIGSPMIKRTDALIAMNLPSLTKFRSVTGDVIVTDERFVDDISDTAADIGARSEIIGVNTELCNGGQPFDGLSNMMMIGALLNSIDILSMDAVRRAISALAKPAAAAKDIAAADYGRGRTNIRRKVS